MKLNNSILHICVALNRGGIESILYKILYQTHQTIDNYVICFNDKGAYGDKIESLGIKVVYLNNKKGRFSFSSIFKLYSTIKTISPDSVQTWWYPADIIGGIIAKLAGVKRVYWGIFSANFELKYLGIGTFLFFPIAVIFSHIVPYKIISCTQYGLELHNKFGYAKKKLVFIPPGVDVSDFPFKFNSTNTFDTTNYNFVISCVGRFDPLKDHGTLLMAFSNYILSYNPNALLILVGHGINVSNLKLLDLINKSNVPFKNLMLIENLNDISEIFQASDLNVLTSVGEGFPNVLIESMSCGTLCLATDVGDCKFILNDNGWIVNKKDSQNIAKHFNYFFNNYKLDKELMYLKGLEIREFVNCNYSLDKMVTSYLNLWFN